MPSNLSAAYPDAACPLAPSEFEEIRKLAHRSFGLVLKPGREDLVGARLRSLLRTGGYDSFHAYYRGIVEDATGESLAAMIDALATNYTSFMREPEHFDFLRCQVLPELGARDTVEIWSAACSTGEEVWSLAMLLHQFSSSRRFRLLASDISSKALAFAGRAVYSSERCQEVPPHWLARYFLTQGEPAAYSVVPALRGRVDYRRINLVHPFPAMRPFPVIFCRNVMIYFDRETQEQVVRRLVDCLEPGGYLFVGQAEALTGMSRALEYVRPAIYRKRNNPCPTEY